MSRRPPRPYVSTATSTLSGRRAWHFWVLALAIVVVDQALKLAIKLNMQYGEEHNLVGSLFRLHFTENKGAAFGLTLSDLFGMGDEVAKITLTLFSLLLVGGIAYYLHSVRHMRTGLPWWIALILGGAFGNIIDRVFYGVWFAEINNYEGGLLHGRVVDMFYLHFWQGWVPEDVPLIGGAFRVFDFAIFNIADAAISVGIVVVLIFQRRFFGEAKPASVPATDTTTDTADAVAEDTAPDPAAASGAAPAPPQA